MRIADSSSLVQHTCAGWLILLLTSLSSGCMTALTVQKASLADVASKKFLSPTSTLCLVRYRSQLGRADWRDVKERTKADLQNGGQAALGAALVSLAPVPVVAPFPARLALPKESAAKLREVFPFGERAVCGPIDLLFDAALIVGNVSAREYFHPLTGDQSLRKFSKELGYSLDLGSAQWDSGGCVKGTLRFRSTFSRYEELRQVCPPSAAKRREAEQLMKSGECAKALHVAQQAREEVGKLFSEGHPANGFMLQQLSRIHACLGDYAESLTSAQRAVLSLEKVAGPDDLIGLHNQIAEIHLLFGDFDLAAAQLAKAKPYAARLPASNVEALTMQGLVGSLYQSRGQFRQAESVLRAAVALAEKVTDLPPNLLAELLRKTTVLHAAMGRFSEAERTGQRALSLLTASKETQPKELLALLLNLGDVYLEEGASALAQSLFEQAQKLCARHSLSAKALVRLKLGLALAQAGNPRMAEPLLSDSIQKLRDERGLRDPSVVLAYMQVARFFADQGKLDRAAHLLDQIDQAARAEGHADSAPDALFLSELAQIRLWQNRAGEAAQLLERVLAASERGLAEFLSESSLAGYLDKLRHTEDLAYSLLMRRPNDPSTRRLALAFALLRKGRIQELAARSAAGVLQRAQDADTQTRLLKLYALRSQIARVYLQTSRINAQETSLLEERADRFEHEVAEVLESARGLPAPPSVDRIVQEVAAQLPKDAALVEFVAFRPLRAPGEAPPFGPEEYLLLVLLPDQQILLAQLGQGSAMAERIDRFRTALADSHSSIEKVAQDLFQATLGTLHDHLVARSRMFVAPDGQLNLIPMAALFDGEKYLVDRFQISYLTSGRDLLRKRSRGTVANGRGSVLVFADPDFRGSWSQKDRQESEFGRAVAQLERLPGARREAAEITKIFPEAVVLGEQQATEAAFLAVQNPKVLHVATHGVFWGEEDSGLTLKQRGFARVKTDSGAQGEPTLSKSGVVRESERAQLSRSALVLANPQATDAVIERDGIATALEVAGMDLRRTRLVVLSACETGKGSVTRRGQGVYGLRRAFVVAGAETVVTSLWKIDDDATQELMSGYYQGLAQGKGRLEALTTAAKRLRSHRPHPYYWAPFILIGRGDPL